MAFIRVQSVDVIGPPVGVHTSMVIVALEKCILIPVYVHTFDGGCSFTATAWLTMKEKDLYCEEFLYEYTTLSFRQRTQAFYNLFLSSKIQLVEGNSWLD